MVTNESKLSKLFYVLADYMSRKRKQMKMNEDLADKRRTGQSYLADKTLTAINLI